MIRCRRTRCAPASRLPSLAEVTSADGTRFMLRGLRSSLSAPVVVILPAMGAPARFYQPVARALHRTGLNVVTMDLRGHGECVPPVTRSSRFGYREIVEDDLTAVFAAVTSRFPAAPVIVLGHSLGGQLALLHLARRRACGDPGVRGVILLASGSAWHGAFVGWRGPRNLICSQLFALTALIVAYWPGDVVGFGGRQARGMMRDWSRQVWTGRYLLPGGTDYEAALRELTLPVLAIDVEDDDLAPPGAVSHLCAMIPNARISRRRYTRAEVGGKDLGHFRWVRYHQGLVSTLTAWIDQLLSSVERLGDDG